MPGGSRTVQRLPSLTARILDAGTVREIHGLGEGTLEAFVRGLSSGLDEPFDIVEYSEHGRGEGATAEAVAYVSLGVPRERAGRRTEAGEPVYGIARNVDAMTASLQAVVTALNRYLTRASARG